MWREVVIATRKAKGITIKMMSERTSAHITAETITRILNETTSDPHISTVLEIGASVGLSPWELFAEPTMLVAYQSYLTLQAELDALKAERDALAAENAKLKQDVDKATNEAATLRVENERLSLKLEHKDEVINLQKDIIELHKSKPDSRKT